MHKHILPFTNFFGFARLFCNYIFIDFGLSRGVLESKHIHEGGHTHGETHSTPPGQQKGEGDCDLGYHDNTRTPHKPLSWKQKENGHNITINFKRLIAGDISI